MFSDPRREATEEVLENHGVRAAQSAAALELAFFLERGLLVFEEPPSDREDPSDPEDDELSPDFDEEEPLEEPPSDFEAPELFVEDESPSDFDELDRSEDESDPDPFRPESPPLDWLLRP